MENNYKGNSDKKYVYLVTLDWSTEDDKGFEFDICATPEKAFKLFRKMITFIPS